MESDNELNSPDSNITDPDFDTEYLNNDEYIDNGNSSFYSAIALRPSSNIESSSTINIMYYQDDSINDDIISSRIKKLEIAKKLQTPVNFCIYYISSRKMNKGKTDELIAIYSLVEFIHEYQKENMSFKDLWNIIKYLKTLDSSQIDINYVGFIWGNIIKEQVSSYGRQHFGVSGMCAKHQRSSHDQINNKYNIDSIYSEFNNVVLNEKMNTISLQVFSQRIRMIKQIITDMYNKDMNELKNLVIFKEFMNNTNFLESYDLITEQKVFKIEIINKYYNSTLR